MKDGIYWPYPWSWPVYWQGASCIVWGNCNGRWRIISEIVTRIKVGKNITVSNNTVIVANIGPLGTETFIPYIRLSVITESNNPIIRYSRVRYIRLSDIAESNISDISDTTESDIYEFYCSWKRHQVSPQWMLALWGEIFSSDMESKHCWRQCSKCQIVFTDLVQIQRRSSACKKLGLVYLTMAVRGCIFIV